MARYQDRGHAHLTCMWFVGRKKNQITSKDERKVEMPKQESSQLTGSIDGDLHVTSMVLHQRFLWASMHLLLTKSFSERREKEMREELAHAHLCVACWEKIQIVASKERVKKAEPTVVGLQARLQWWTCFFISMVLLKHSLWPAKHDAYKRYKPKEEDKRRGGLPEDSRGWIHSHPLPRNFFAND